MASLSRQAFERLEDENRGMCQRLSDTENELLRKESELKAANARKTELLNDLCELQKKIKELKLHLEKAENAEMEARAVAHDSQRALDHLQSSLRDQSNSSKSSIAVFQQEIKTLKSKLAEKEEQYDSAQGKLRKAEERLHNLETERIRVEKEGSSKLANLNNALAQMKQANEQLTEENASLKRNEQELVQKCERLELTYNELSSNTKSKPCQKCIDRELRQTPVRVRSCITPAKVVPEQSLTDTLQLENAQLKQDLQCIQINFQLTCQKSTQFKTELKEAQKSLSDLQKELEQTLLEKEDLEHNLEEMKLALLNKSETDIGGKQKCAQMQKDMSALRDQLDTMERQNHELQVKITSEMSNHSKTKDQLQLLEARVKVLYNEKAKIESELTTAQEQLAQWSEQLSSHAASSVYHDKLQKQTADTIQAYDQKLMAAKLEVQCCQEQLNALQKANEELVSELGSLKELKKLYETRVSIVEASNQALNDARKNDVMYLQEIEQLKCKLAQLSDDRDALEAEKVKMLEAQQQLQLHTQELSKTSKKAQREANHNWEMTKKLQKDLEKYETSYLKSEEDGQEKQRQLDKALREVDDLKMELKNLQKIKEMYEVEVARLLKRLEELEQANFELNSKLTDIQLETTTVRFAQSDASKRLEEYQKKCQIAEATSLEYKAQINQLEVAAELMERENGTLLSQVNSLSEIVGNRDCKIEGLQKQISGYELESKDIVSRVCELEAEHGQCKATRIKLEDEITSLKDSLMAAQEQVRLSDSAVLSVKLELKQIQEYNSALEAVNSGLQQKIQNQYARIDEFVSSSGYQEKNLHDLEKKLKAKEELLKDALDEASFTRKNAQGVQASLRSKLDLVETKLQALQEAHDDIEKQKKDLGDQLAYVKAELKDKQQSELMLSIEKGDLSEKWDKDKQELEGVKEKLLHSNQNLEGIKRELIQEKKHASEAEHAKSACLARLSQLEEQYEQLKEKTLTVLDDSNENKPLRKIPKRAAPPRSKGALKPIHNVK